jgi:hypothetical protein
LEFCVLNMQKVTIPWDHGALTPCEIPRRSSGRVFAATAALGYTAAESPIV